MYQEIILDHYRNPHHKGLREPYDAEVHHVNPTCGDEVTLRVRVADGVVEDVSYEGSGCSISQASSSVMRSEEHTSELQSRQYLVCRLLLEKKKNNDSSC